MPEQYVDPDYLAAMNRPGSVRRIEPLGYTQCTYEPPLPWYAWPTLLGVPTAIVGVFGPWVWWGLTWLFRMFNEYNSWVGSLFQ